MITGYQLRSVTHPQWRSLTYVYRAQAEAEQGQHPGAGTLTLLSCETDRLSGQLVATDRFGGCTQRRTVTQLRYGRRAGRPVIYGQVQVRRQQLRVVLPRYWTGHDPLWRVIKT
jgi:hypothetical protein